jgi:uncharacterized protein
MNRTRAGRVTATQMACVAVLISFGATAKSLGQDVPERAQRPEPPTISVAGRGEVDAQPDRVTVRLGAVGEAKDAATAQQKVNEIMQRTLKRLREMELADSQIRTASLTLSPIYEQEAPTPEREGRHREQRIVGYRAANTVELETSDLGQVGAIIDRGIASGANHLEGVSFHLQNDLEARSRALRMAVEEAKNKAGVMARALGVQLSGIREAVEGGVHIVQPRLEMARAGFGGGASTPVEPGTVRIEATVTIRFSMRQAPGTGVP